MGQNRGPRDRRSSPRPGSKDRRGNQRVRKLRHRMAVARVRKGRKLWRERRRQREADGFFVSF